MPSETAMSIFGDLETPAAKPPVPPAELTVHDKADDDEPFVQGLLLVEHAATDESHFVKKAVNMALRAIGKRNRTLNAAAVAVAQRLSESTAAAPRWVGKDALRELTSPTVTTRLTARR